MMEQFFQLAHAFRSLDIAAMSDPSLLPMLVGTLVLFLIMENGILPAAFLPGDTLLIMTGVLIFQGVLGWWVVPLLVLAAFFGTWLGYMQGRFFSHTKLYHRLISHIDVEHQDRAYYLLNKYGIITLLMVRFIAFVRTVYPCIVGASGISQGRFLVINLISAVLWIVPLVSFGFLISHSKLAAQYQDQFLSIILILPLFFLVFGCLALVWRYVRRRQAQKL